MIEKISQFFGKLSEDTTDLAKEQKRRDALKHSALLYAANYIKGLDIGKRLRLSDPQLKFFGIHLARYNLLKSTYELNRTIHTPEADEASRLPIIGKAVRITMAVINRHNGAAEELEREAESFSDCISKEFFSAGPSLAEIRTAANVLTTISQDHFRNKRRLTGKDYRKYDKDVDQALTQIAERFSKDSTAHHGV